MTTFIRFVFLIIFILPHNPALSNGAINENIGDHDIPISKHEIARDVDPMVLSQLTEEERQWFEKFQDGLMFFDGWRDISKDILVCFPQKEQGGVKDLLEAMGTRIGLEWSKDNKIRKIDTDQLRSWGRRLKEARQQSTAQLKETVKIISSEVDAILLKE